MKKNKEISLNDLPYFIFNGSNTFPFFSPNFKFSYFRCVAFEVWVCVWVLVINHNIKQKPNGNGTNTKRRKKLLQLYWIVHSYELFIISLFYCITLETLKTAQMLVGLYAGSFYPYIGEVKKNNKNKWKDRGKLTIICAF